MITGDTRRCVVLSFLHKEQTSSPRFRFDIQLGEQALFSRVTDAIRIAFIQIQECRYPSFFLSSPPFLLACKTASPYIHAYPKPFTTLGIQSCCR